MRSMIGCCAAILFVAAMASPADARGCLKGAVVGGTAGHFAGHHGLLGAAAGCVIGRHRANEQSRETTGQNRRDRYNGQDGPDRYNGQDIGYRR